MAKKKGTNNSWYVHYIMLDLHQLIGDPVDKL